MYSLQLQSGILVFPFLPKEECNTLRSDSPSVINYCSCAGVFMRLDLWTKHLCWLGYVKGLLHGPLLCGYGLNLRSAMDELLWISSWWAFSVSWEHCEYPDWLSLGHFVHVPKLISFVLYPLKNFPPGFPTKTWYHISICEIHIKYFQIAMQTFVFL